MHASICKIPSQIHFTTCLSLQFSRGANATDETPLPFRLHAGFSKRILLLTVYLSCFAEILESKVLKDFSAVITFLYPSVHTKSHSVFIFHDTALGAECGMKVDAAFLLTETQTFLGLVFGWDGKDWVWLTVTRSAKWCIQIVDCRVLVANMNSVTPSTIQIL